MIVNKLATACAALFVVIVLFVTLNWLETKQCKRQAIKANTDYRYSIFGGCELQAAKGYWYPADNYGLVLRGQKR